MTKHERICWPYVADQPIMAAHLTINLDVAFELLEIRTGVHGLKKPYRFGDSERKLSGTLDAIKFEFEAVLASLNTEVGLRKRSNARKLRDQFASAVKQSEIVLDEMLKAKKVAL